MKNPIVVIALLASTLAGVQAQVTGNATQTTLAQPALPVPTAYSVVENGPNHRVWERIVYEPGPNGTVVGRKHRYTELASGLNFRDPTTGRWTPSKEQIDLLPPGGAFAAAATHGQHQAWFPLDIAQGVIQLATPDGKQLQSRPIALAYDDGNQTVLFAILTNSIGELVGFNQVIYPDAFEGATASLRYTYTKAGFEQDVIVQGQLPTPDSLGLNRTTAKLFVMTEFFDNNNPEESSLPVNPADGLSDAVLTFGTMKMVGGQAFSIGTSDQSAAPTGETPTYKSWVRLNGRKFLIEQVPYSRVAPQLEQLPSSGRVNAGSTNLMAVNSILKKGSAGALLPPSRGLKSEAGNRKSEMTRQLARTDGNQTRGLVLDYTTLNSNQTNYVFQGDTTYYISGTVDLFGTTTIEGGTVVKYATSLPYLGVYYGTVNCLAAPYRPAVFTAIDDDSVGEAISGSTGSPAGSYAFYALLFYNPASPVNLQDLRISYAIRGIGIVYCSTGGHAIRDSQICHVAYDAIFCSSAVSCLVENTLIYQAGDAAFYDSNTTIGAAQLTIDQANRVLFGGSLYLTNSLLVQVTNAGTAYTSVNNATNSSSAAVFQTVGAASHYLTNNSPYHQQGTANIDPGLLLDLATKTTYPPIVYSNITFSIATNFSPQAQRDTNSSPDLGYHYDPLDYVFGGVNVYSNLTFTAGTAVGYFELPGSGGAGYGISIFDNVVLALNGTASRPCTVARYSTVQEGGTSLWRDKGWLAAIAGQSLSGGYYMNPANAAQVWPNFTRHAALAGDPPHYREYSALLKVAAQNSEFWGSGVGAYWDYLNFTNCLFDRAAFGNLGGNPAICGVRNCTMHGGSITLYKYNQTWPVWIEECAFDGTAFSVDDNSRGNTNITYCDFNAFLSNSNRLPMLGTHDVTNLLSFNWQSSWLGNYYLPTNSPLINAGSTTADRVGLYHFTTQTNQTKEGISPVDIGYHYVATDQSGNPLETLTNNMPDYLVDADGDGLLDSWEMSWFGNLNHTGSELDTSGMSTLLYDHQHGLDPIYSSMVVGWGDDHYGESDVSPGITNAVMVAGGVGYSLAQLNDGTVVGWGNSLVDGWVPTNLIGVAMIASGWNHNVALLTNGIVTNWGFNFYDELNIPPELTNARAISAQALHSLALINNGTVVAWGYNSGYGDTSVSAGLTSVTSIAAGGYHNLAVSNGFVVAWGDNSSGQTNVPSGLSSVWKVAAGWAHSVALKSNGTVVCWGDNTYGETNVPVGLSNVVAIAAGGDPFTDQEGAYTLALKNDGTVVAWGNGPVVLSLGGLINVTSIGGGDDYGLAVRKGPPTPVITLEPTDQYQIAGGSVTFTAKGQGLYGVTYQWQTNGVNLSGATNATLTLTNVQAAQAGVYDVVVTGNGGLGSITSSNANLYVVTPPVVLSQSPQQTNLNFGVTYQTNVTLSVVAWAPGMTNGFPLSYQWLANGASVPGATVASNNFYAVAPSTNQYSVVVSNIAGSVTSFVWQVTAKYAINVTNDLLLIYNSNSADSSNLCAYYLANRPMVGGANVLGVACDVGEFTTSNNCDAQIVFPVLNWLTNNPTKRPQYVILFYDIPTRLTNSYPYDSYGSIGYHLHILRPDWQPFVNYINASNLVDCVAYVNKLAAFGSNYSPGQLIISPSAGGIYCNTNFVLDNVRHGPGFGDDGFEGKGDVVSNAIPAITNANRNCGYIYIDGVETTNVPFLSHITNAANVAGYICWGGHSDWGTNMDDGNFPLDGNVIWTGNSGWWIINTPESFNGQRDTGSLQSNFLKWFSSTAFGGTNYSNTPVGACSNVEEPNLETSGTVSTYFSRWASGENFGVCAWNARNTVYFQAIGDPFVSR
jgi:hypothetical protein